MKKKGLSYFIIGILLITLIPIEIEQAIPAKKVLSGDIYVESIEPIQVIEDSDTLVTNKPTVLRVTVQSTFTTIIFIDIEITYDFGTKTYLDKGQTSKGIHLSEGVNTIYLPGGPVYPGWGTTWDHPEGFLKWTNTGYDGLIKVVLDPDDEIVEIDETNNEKFIYSPIRVANAPMVKILYVPIAFPGSEDWTVDEVTMNTQKWFMLSTYPLARTDLRFEAGPLWRFSLSPPVGEGLINWLYEVVAYPIACTTRIMGYQRVIICWDKLASGYGLAIGMLRNPEIREPVVVSSSMPNKDLVGHEIGHTYYLWHPHDLGPPVFTDECFYVGKQEYGETLDVFMSYRDDPTWIDKGRYDSDPKTLLPAGNYHFPGDPEIEMEPYDDYIPVSTWQWNLMDQLTIDPTIYSCIMVHGLLQDDGTITLNHSWYRIEAVPDVPQQPIKHQQNEEYYFIIFLNNNNQVISTFPFSASFNYVTHDDKTGLLENAVTDTVPFIFNIKEVEGTRLIQIQNADGQILAEREVTQNSPNVQVIYPNGGEEFKVGDKINIEWEAYDQDQDTLRYTLAYSNNSGETWIPIAFDIKETSFEWNTFDQSKGNYLIKVIASDGVNVGEDISDDSFILPKTKAKNHLSLIRVLEILIGQLLLLERFPNAFQILRYIMGV